MIRYRPNPHGENRFLEASPEDIRSMRPFVRKTFRKLNINAEDAEDLAQNVEIITWQAIDEGLIREHRKISPYWCLRIWMMHTAWRVGLNHKRRFYHRYELRIEADMPIEQDERIHARELLERLLAYPDVLALLIRMAEGGLRRDGAPQRGTYWQGDQARHWLRVVKESGRWREPPGREKPRPRDRKKNR